MVLAGAGRLRAQGGASQFPEPVEGNFVTKAFTFTAGGRCRNWVIHYRTIGTPRRDASGIVRNAVLILHGTGGTGASFLSRGFAGQLFGPGQILDATKYFIVLPDGIGHGKSSKPSDGLHARFPEYTYDDMVRAQYLMLTEGLKVNHMRLVMGTSMGAMQCWVWGEMYPDFADGLMPLASLPVQIAGRNRVMRTMIMDSIKNDPAWHDGEYTTPPKTGLIGAENLLLMMTSSPLQWQKQHPSRDEADRWYEDTVARAVKTTDANDMLYQFNSSRDYDPSPNLEKITAALLAINSADDQVNPPELGIMEKLITRVKRGSSSSSRRATRRAGTALTRCPRVGKLSREFPERTAADQ